MLALTFKQSEITNALGYCCSDFSLSMKLKEMLTDFNPTQISTVLDTADSNAFQVHIIHSSQNIARITNCHTSANYITGLLIKCYKNNVIYWAFNVQNLIQVSKTENLFFPLKCWCYGEKSLHDHWPATGLKTLWSVWCRLILTNWM